MRFNQHAYGGAGGDASGAGVGGSGGSGAALTAVWKPDDITKVKVRGEFSREDYDPLANVRIGSGCLSTASACHRSMS